MTNRMMHPFIVCPFFHILLSYITCMEAFEILTPKYGNAERVGKGFWLLEEMPT